MSGPVAPKDPEKDRSYFYIMKEKETFGSAPDAGGVSGQGRSSLSTRVMEGLKAVRK